MSSETCSQFQEFIAQVRSGDEKAAAEFVRVYGPAIHRAMHGRLTDPRLRRVYDSEDGCVSVLGDFFKGVVDGKFKLETPEGLLGLLMQMVRHKVLNRSRDARARRCDNRRTAADYDKATGDIAAATPDPAKQVERKDFIESVRGLLPPDELKLFDLRREGDEWNDIGQPLGLTGNAARKKVHRALQRIGADLGLVEACHA
jgi:DNA-directed RNA polymerase specialized sigma24 family protein